MSESSLESGVLSKKHGYQVQHHHQHGSDHHSLGTSALDNAGVLLALCSLKKQGPPAEKVDSCRGPGDPGEHLQLRRHRRRLRGRGRSGPRLPGRPRERQQREPLPGRRFWLRVPGALPLGFTAKRPCVFSEMKVVRRCFMLRASAKGSISVFLWGRLWTEAKRPACWSLSATAWSSLVGAAKFGRGRVASAPRKP